jgi:SPP1 gp7 family putative phage head morphogenesis protein
MHVRHNYFDNIETEIQRLFDEIIYAPLARILRAKYPHEMQNDLSLPALSAAVKNGSVWYSNAQFFGSFNSAIGIELRSLGATWNKKGRTYSLARELVPPQIQSALALADNRFKALQGDLLTALNDMQPADKVTKKSRTKDEYAATLGKMDTDWRQSLAPATKSISIPANLTDAQKQVIARDWGENLDLYIKDWAEENITKLRAAIQDNVLTGGRAEGMEKQLMQSYGVSRRKAKFLARQETSLLMSKFQETRYQEAGITEYKWSGADDERERPDHRALNNKIFRFDNPPVTNKSTGARNNPGEDFGCRCIAIPIVPGAPRV